MMMKCVNKLEGFHIINETALRKSIFILFHKNELTRPLGDEAERKKAAAFINSYRN